MRVDRGGEGKCTIGFHSVSKRARMSAFYKIVISPGDGGGHGIIGWAQSALGGTGLTPSGNVGDKAAVFEAAHETAPGREGKGIAHSIATLLAAKLMLEYLSEKEAGDRIQAAVDRVIEKGKVLPFDMGGRNTWDQVGEAIIRKLLN